MKPLINTIVKVRRRMVIQQTVHFCTVALFFAALVAILFTLLARFFPVLGDSAIVYPSLAGLALVLGLVYSVLNRPSLAVAAHEADRRAGLAERILSSYQMAEVSGPMVEAVHVDALQHLPHVRPGEHFAYRTPVDLPKLAVAVMILGLVYVFMPEFDLLHYREKQAHALAEKQSAQLKAKALTAVAKPLKKQAENPEMAEKMQEMELIAQQLHSQEINEKQALAKIQKLSEKILEDREKLSKQFDPPHMRHAKQQNKGAGNDQLSKALSEGDLKKAAEKIREMAEKMKSGTLSKEDAEKLAQQMKSLQQALSGEQSEMQQSLSDAMSKLSQFDSLTEEELSRLEQVSMDMEDIASLLDQMVLTDAAMREIAKWQNIAMGPSPYCRMCGSRLKPCKNGSGCKGCGPGSSCFGVCANCMGMGGMRWAFGDSSRQGTGGLSGAGRGRGNEVGALPDEQVEFQPEVLSGERANGKVLASLFEKALPEEGQEATKNYIEGVFMQAQQDAEQAMTKEEIPPGARELVRQYFLSIEPENETSGGNSEGE